MFTRELKQIQIISNSAKDNFFENNFRKVAMRLQMSWEENIQS